MHFFSADDDDETHAASILLYLCMSANELILVDPKAEYAPYRENPQFNSIFPADRMRSSHVNSMTVNDPGSSNDVGNMGSEFGKSDLAMVDLRGVDNEIQNQAYGNEGRKRNVCPYIIFAIPYHFLHGAIGDVLREVHMINIGCNLIRQIYTNKIVYNYLIEFCILLFVDGWMDV
jgi:hypothetical protein